MYWIAFEYIDYYHGIPQGGGGPPQDLKISDLGAFSYILAAIRLFWEIFMVFASLWKYQKMFPSGTLRISCGLT